MPAEQKDVATFIGTISLWQQARKEADYTSLRLLTQDIYDKVKEWNKKEGNLHIIGNTLSYFVYQGVADLDILNPAVVIALSDSSSKAFSSAVEELKTILDNVKVCLLVNPIPITTDSPQEGLEWRL
jgi:hypothetical protein